MRPLAVFAALCAGCAHAPTAKLPLAKSQAQPPAAQAHVEHGRWTDDRFGLAADVPVGFVARTDVPGFLLVLRREEPTRAFGALQFWPTTLDAELEEQLFDAFAGQFSSGVGGIPPREEDRGSGAVAFGEGRDRSWSYPGSYLHVRASLLDICGGHAMLLFAQVWEDADGARAIDDWLASVKPLGASPAACARR